MGETSTKRFQYWELSGQGRIVGQRPVPSDTTPAYYVELDLERSGRVVQVREYMEGHAAPLVRRPTYEREHVISSEYTDPIRGRQGTNFYEYDERGFLKRRFERTPKGRVRFEVEIVCDDRGNFAEERLFDGHRRLKTRRTYQHDAHHRLLRETAYGGPTGEELEGFFTFAHDKKGLVVRRAWHGPDGVERRAFTYAYDQHQRRISVGLEEAGEAAITLHKALGADGKVASTELLDARGARVGGELAPGATVTSLLGSFPEEELNDTERALLAGKKKLADVLEISAEQRRALTLVAYSHLERQRYPEARSLFEALAALDADDVYALAGAGAACLLGGQFSSALSFYQRVLEHDPRHLPALGGKAEALVHLGRVEEALPFFQQLVALAPPDDPVLQHARALLIAATEGQPGSDR
jgi:thioredoxin-like negative regulator of GroEL